jgi:hypothetical protein
MAHSQTSGPGNHGQSDSRKSHGKVWLAGKLEPLHIDLVGNPWSDMAGCVLTFEQPNAVAELDPLDGLATEQRGVCGDFTASRKVKIPTVPINEWLTSHPDEPFPYVWGNSVYLEWYSEHNGRVVIELTGVQAHLSQPAWRMSIEQEQEQRRCNLEAMNHFMHRLTATSSVPTTEANVDHAGEKPESNAGLETAMETHADADKTLDQRQRIEALKQKVRDRVGGNMLCGEDESAPLDVVEKFWQRVLEFEENTPPLRPLRDLLAEDGIYPPPPDLLLDEDIPTNLKRLAGAMAQRGLLLCQTDHLSDRELYTLLVERVLREETEAYPPESGWFTHVEISQFGTPDGENGSQVYLRYYADEDEREQWHLDFRMIRCRRAKIHSIIGISCCLDSSTEAISDGTGQRRPTTSLKNPARVPEAVDQDSKCESLCPTQPTVKPAIKSPAVLWIAARVKPTRFAAFCTTPFGKRPFS